MDDESANRWPPGKPQNNGGGDPAPSGVAILLFFAAVSVACVGGYFLLMKLIDISRQEDCMLGGGRNCVRIEVPSER